MTYNAVNYRTLKLNCNFFQIEHKSKSTSQKNKIKNELKLNKIKNEIKLNKMKNEMNEKNEIKIDKMKIGIKIIANAIHVGSALMGLLSSIRLGLARKILVLA